MSSGRVGGEANRHPNKCKQLFSETRSPKRNRKSGRLLGICSSRYHEVLPPIQGGRGVVQAKGGGGIKRHPVWEGFCMFSLACLLLVLTETSNLLVDVNVLFQQASICLFHQARTQSWLAVVTRKATWRVLTVKHRGPQWNPGKWERTKSCGPLARIFLATSSCNPLVVNPKNAGVSN